MFMVDLYAPINAKCAQMLHGADYNPEQWPAELWSEDMRLMDLAHCNSMTVGIFSWARLEPEEGRYEFDWLDRIMDMLAENEMYAVVATPSGARPAWMSAKYPEVLRVRPDRSRNLHGLRHNHCFTSPIYREKVGAINTRLAERYRDHPALLLWHLSNEYGGACHCELCREAFRTWLKERSQPGLVGGILEPHVQRLVPVGSAQPHWRIQCSRPEPGMDALYHRSDHRFYAQRDGPVAGTDAGCAHHH
jgi:beta-galactosidase